MKAAFMTAVNEMKVMETATPSPGPGEVLLRIRSVAVCASDLHLFEEGSSSGAYPDLPFILGHEFSGEVAALGEGVTSWQIGDRVACEPSWPCGTCEMCQNGWTNLCQNVIFPSFPGTNGAMAEYIAVPDDSLCALPDGMSFNAGALVEPLGIGMHAVRRSGLRDGDDVAILGAGAIGISVLDVCKHLGARNIYVAEPLPNRQTYPASLGATVVSSAAELEAMFTETASYPPVVFEASGGSTAFDETMPLVRANGTAVILGIPTQDAQTFSARVPRRKELTVRFCRRSRDTLDQCVELVAAGKLHAEDYPIREYSLDEASEAMQASSARADNVIRAIIKPNG